MKLSINQKRLLVDIYNRDESDIFMLTGLIRVMCNQNTLRALYKHGLIEYFDTGIELPNPRNMTFLNGTKKGTLKKLRVTPLGIETAYDILAEDAVGTIKL